MSYTNNSMVMGIPANTENMKQYLAANHSNASTALKMVGIKSISRYSSCVIECMSECASKRHRIISAKEFYYAILTLERIERSRLQTEVESVIKAAALNLICQGSTEVRRDAAACLTVAEMCEMSEENPSLTPGSGKIADALIHNLNKCGISCRIVPNGTKSSLNGSPQVNTENEKNLVLAMTSLGVIDSNNSVVIDTAAKLQKSPDVISINDIAKQLIASGIKTNAMMALILRDIAKKSLGTIWPVGLVWPPFELGTGTGGEDVSLGADAPTPSTGDQATSMALKLLEKAVGAGIELAQNYSQAQINKMTAEADKQMKDLMSKSMGVPPESITDNQMQTFANNNKAQTDAIIADAALKAKIELDAEKRRNKILIYAGAGVGTLLLAGIAFMALRKKSPEPKAV